MLVDGSQFKQLYDAVKADRYQSEDKNILVFVSNSDVDAICAVKQLQVRPPPSDSPPTHHMHTCTCGRACNWVCPMTV